MKVAASNFDLLAAHEAQLSAYEDDLVSRLKVRPWERLDYYFQGYYSNYMKILQLKVSRIGNSRGVRLPAASLRRYRIGTAVLMEERSDGIFLRPVGPVVEKLSWADTAREMAAGREDWGEWDVADADGLDSTPWRTGKAGRKAEKSNRFRSVLQSTRKS